MIAIPYGHGNLELAAPACSWELLTADTSSLSSLLDEGRIVLDAMENPIGSPHLSKLAKGRNNAVIIISDHTRPVPSQFIIPFMLNELRRGNPNIDITLLVATGFHRLTTQQELLDKLGQDIIENEKIVVHDSSDNSMLVDCGKLPSGAQLVVNRLAVETDLLLAEGFIEPHFFAGFSGGRKSVLPGVCSRTTVLGNHCAAFIDSEYAHTGILNGNPIHIDMLSACRIVGLEYIVNVILDEEKRIAAAFAGHPEHAHQAGCDELLRHCMAAPKQKGDIVITSNGGAPLDQNIYQAVKGLATAKSASAPGAVLIMCAECADGTGSDDLHEKLRDCNSPEELLEEIRTIPMDKTEPDQWQYQILARILKNHQVIFVTRPELKKAILDMKMQYANTLDEAVALALKLKGGYAHMVIIPDGIAIIVKGNSQAQ